MAQDSAFATFEAIATQLYGDVVDPRELWELTKNAPSGPDLHVEGGDKKKHKLAHAGLLASGVATVGGVHALHVTQRDLRRDVKTPRAAGAEPAVKLGRIKISPKTAAVGAGVGWLALHTAELGGDAAGIHAQRKLLKDKKKQLAKGLRVKKVKMTTAQLADWKKLRTTSSTNGVRALLGAGTVGGAAVGHHYGVKRGKKLAAEPVAKSFRVKPLNAVDAPRVVSLKARKRPMAPPLAKSLVWTGEISKVDEDKHQVFGWCSLSTVDGKPVVDLQGDFVPLEEIEKSAYKYVIESRKGGDMHKRVAKNDEPLHTADLIESFVVTPEKLAAIGLAEDTLPHGWWVGFKVNDEAQWAMVKSGERAGFSIHGTGHRQAVAA